MKNSKLSRLLATVTLGVVTATGLCVGVSACGHEHEWQWRSENGMHWQECTGCDEKSAQEAHKDANNDLVCDDCEAQLTPASTAVTGITISGAATVVAGQTITLTANFAPVGATGTVTWTSSDTSKATVNGGVVTGVAAGTVTITATVGSVTQTKTITVTAAQQNVPVTGVAISGADEVTVGESITLQATVTPDNATNATVTWDIQPAGVATIDQNGVVTGVAPGTAYVMASAGGVNSDMKTITVNASVSATGVTLDKSAATVTVGGTTTITATVAPSNASNKKVTWTSSDETKATVDEDGVVTGVAAGTATITATTEDGSFTATCTVTVEAAPVPVETVTITEGASGTLDVGASLTLHATVAPEDATNKTVAWASKNTAVATVDAATGVVTAVASGTAEITATAGGVTATYTVTAQTIYDRLAARADNLIAEDFSSYTNGENLTTDGDFAVRGIFGSMTDKAGSDPTKNYVKITNGAAELVDTTAGGTILNVPFGQIKGDLEVYFETTLKDSGASWTLVQFQGISGTKNGGEVFGLRTAADSVLKYRIDGNETADGIVNAATYGNSTLKVYFKYNAADKTITVTINGKEYLKNLQTTITELQGIKFVSSDNGSKTQTVDNIAVNGTEKTVEEVKDGMIAKLDAEYAKYILADTMNEAGEPVTATHSINGADVTAAYNAGKTAMEEAADLNTLSQAYASAVAAMKAVESDATVTAARTTAKTALSSYKNSDDYDETNAATLAQKIKAGESAIDAAKNSAAITAALDAAKAEIDAIQTKAQQLAAAITEAKQTLADYKTTDIEAIEDEEMKAQITGLKTEGATTLSAVTNIANVQTTLDGILAEIDDAIELANKGPEEAIAEKKAALVTYANTAKADVADEYQTAIDAIVAKYNVGTEATEDEEAVAALFDGCTKVADVNKAYADAVDEIDLVVAKATAIAAVEAHRDSLKSEYYLATAKALFDTECTKQVESINDADSEADIDIEAAKDALDGKKEAATNLELAARATWTGTETGPKQYTLNCEATAGEITSGKEDGIFTLSYASNSSKKMKYSGTYITTNKATGATITFTTKNANAKLYMAFDGVNEGRTFTLDSVTYDQKTDFVKGKQVKEITLATAGEHTIAFDDTEHKVTTLYIIETVTETITAPVHKVTATKAGEEFTVKIRLNSDDGSEKTLEAGEYTVIEEADKYIVIYGTGKTAADANKYNSCEVAKA